MEEILEKTLLYDFYGELLTPHQKKIYEAAVFEDLSLSEIAEAEGISRQGVHDLIRRCSRILTGYEETLHLVEKFGANRKRAGMIYETAQRLQSGTLPLEVQAGLEEIAQTAQTMLEQF